MNRLWYFLFGFFCAAAPALLVIHDRWWHGYGSGQNIYILAITGAVVCGLLATITNPKR